MVVVLPASVRARVVAWAADCLGDLSPAEVPAGLRPFLRFRAERRARLAAVPLAAAVASDEAFRRRVAARVRTRAEELAAALDRGRDIPAAEPADVAAAAYLLRPAGWQQRIAVAVAALAAGQERDEAAAVQAARHEAEARIRAAHERAEAEVARYRDDLAAATAELRTLRREVRERTGEARAALLRVQALEEEVRRVREDAEAAAARARAETRRLQARLTEAEEAADLLRRTARDGRAAGDLRARLLLDTVLGAARGLERELALPPAVGAPADAVATGVAGPGPTTPGGGLGPDDPAWLDQLLALPRAHLVVDGYNVTKQAYGALTLADQRTRLVTALAGLGARTSAEVTVVFDGAQREPGLTVAWPRGVRVLFSEPGEIADALILRLVRAEPPGRPVVVVSSDREVADGSRAAGARSVPAGTLARLLAR